MLVLQVSTSWVERKLGPFLGTRYAQTKIE